jgi:hypothetical protein
MENIELAKKDLITKTYKIIEAISSAKLDLRKARKGIYNCIADNYDVVLQYGVNYPKRYSENQLENLSEEELIQIGKLLRIGMLDENKFGTPISGDYYENIKLRRDMMEEEKVLFLSYLNKIYGYRGRYDLISIFFLERHTEEERTILLQKLAKYNMEYIEGEAKLLEKKSA